MAFTPNNLSLMGYTSGPTDKKQLWFYVRPGSDDITADFYFDKAPGMRTGDFLLSSTGVFRYVDERADVARPATGTLTVVTAVNVENLDTVEVDDKTYTFTTGTPDTEGQVKVGANATASMVNLMKAINASGTDGTDYKVAAAHPTVEGNETGVVDDDDTVFTVTAKASGTVGNAYDLVGNDRVTASAAKLADGRNVNSTTTTAVNT